MRKVVLLALLAMSLPVAAVATTIDWNLGGGGTVQITPGPVTVHTNVINTSVCAPTCVPNGATGTAVLVFPTFNPLVSGSFGNGGSVDVSSGGGTFAFSGVWDGGAADTWTVGGGLYAFQGFASGLLTVGSQKFVADLVFANGATIGTCPATTTSCSLPFSSGDIQAPMVPEPGTLGLLGTGLIGLAGAVHRKLVG